MYFFYMIAIILEKDVYEECREMEGGERGERALRTLCRTFYSSVSLLIINYERFFTY